MLSDYCDKILSLFTPWVDVRNGAYRGETGLREYSGVAVSQEGRNTFQGGTGGKTRDSTALNCGHKTEEENRDNHSLEKGCQTHVVMAISRCIWIFPPLLNRAWAWPTHDASSPRARCLAALP